MGITPIPAVTINSVDVINDMSSCDNFWPTHWIHEVSPTDIHNNRRQQLSGTELERENALAAFLQTPAPVYWINFLDPWVHDFIQYWAGVWHPRRESATPPSTSTGSKSVSQTSFSVQFSCRSSRVLQALI